MPSPQMKLLSKFRNVIFTKVLQPQIYAVILALALIIILLTALGGRAGSAIGISLLTLISGASVGAFFGFLFSVPRVIIDNAQAGVEITGDLSRVNHPTSRKRLIQTNSNLEQISDWLTTLIVGAALVNIKGVAGFFKSFHDFLRDSISGSRNELPGPLQIVPVAGTLLLVIGLVSGFLVMYLATRIKLAGILNIEERKLQQEPLDSYETEQIIDVAKSFPPAAGLDNLILSGIVYPEEAVQIMNRLLYEDDGYIKTIEIATVLIPTKASLLPSFWFYLAAAYGQMYTKLLNESPEDKDTLNTKIHALNAARRAVSIDSRYKKELVRISNPSGPDDDLKDLRNDPDFISIVGPD